ncbi:MAG: hypothetical protein J7K00_04275 [Candidatus Diapherotrites archaeon]|nr:hypothetical protein [Candidatus Diapherotrites archaeon]
MLFQKQTRKKGLKNDRRAVNQIISTVLLVSAAASLMVTTYYWANASLAGLQSDMDLNLNTQISKLRIDLDIKPPPIDCSANSAPVFVYNAGTATGTEPKAFFDGTQYSPGSGVPTAIMELDGSACNSIESGTACYFNIDCNGATDNETLDGKTIFISTLERSAKYDY